MSRLEKKCFVSSAGAHAFLALLLCLAPILWVTQRPEIMRPALISIPSRLIDGVMSGGGSPKATAPPAPAAAADKPVLAPPAPVIPKPEPAPAKPEPKPAKQETEAPPKPRTHKAIDTVTVPDKKMAQVEETDDSPKASKRKPEFTLTRETGTEKSKQKSAAERRAEARAEAAALQRQFADRVKGIVGAIGERASTGTSIEVPGPGGEAYADYGQFVQFFYKNAWAPPTDVDDKAATVRVRVVIRRDGTVDSFVIVDRSGKPVVDSSVDRLKHIKTIRPFPEGTTDERRTFLIDFNLRPDNRE